MQLFRGRAPDRPRLVEILILTLEAGAVPDCLSLSQIKSDVLVMQSAENWDRHYAADWFDGT